MQTPLQTLRTAMRQHDVDAVLIPTSDFHGSEYAGTYFAARAYLSSFDGSAGTLLVLHDWAGLWTDARYFLQAEQQLLGSDIELLREGLPETLSIEQVLRTRLGSGDCLLVDGRCLSARRGAQLQKALTTKEIRVRTDLDLPGLVWPERPPLSAAPAWLLADCHAGETRAHKLARVRAALSGQAADILLLSSLEEIAWLLNLRGGDIDCTPVALAYLLLCQKSATLFLNLSIVSPAIRETLELDGVQLASYAAVYTELEKLPAACRVSLDGRSVNLCLREALPSHLRVFDHPSFIEAFKAVKNSTELEQLRLAHHKDGLALTKFLCWLKQRIGKESITERSAAAKLASLRAEQEHYLGPSFAPILAYGAHAAIVHYSATEETDCPLNAEGFLLVDTGGHYLEGTTDCTRTIALGPLSPAMRAHYTAVLRGHLALSEAQFLHGCTGANLDYLARAPLWAMQLDYRHGTGHGVGHLLSVHEGPQQIRWRQTVTAAALEAGMITSNEPGFYLAGQYGIRLENLLLCVPRGESEYGAFLGFEALSLVPFDRDALEPTLMRADELACLNRYHAHVYATLSPDLSPAEQMWLKELTRPL